MDAKEFVQQPGAIQELKDRISQSKVVPPPWARNANYGLTEEEVIANFFTDQGLPFAPYDVEDIKALLIEPTEEPAESGE